MTKKSRKRNRKPLIVTVVILAVLILSGIGYLLLQNLASIDQTLGDIPIEDEVDLSQSYTMPGENLTFDYPASWTLTKEYKENDYGADNSAELTSKNGTKVTIRIPSYGPDWQFGERIFGCPFDQDYNPNSSFNQPLLCPTFTELFSTESLGISGMRAYVFSRTYPTGSTVAGGTDFVLAVSGCKGTDSALCTRPGAKTGYYLEAGGTSPMPGEEFMKTTDASEALSILLTLKY